MNPRSSKRFMAAAFSIAVVSGGFMGLNVVVLQKDAGVARAIIGGLSPHFRTIEVAHTRAELLATVADHNPQAVVLDMEISQLIDVAELHRDFPALPIVCTHRIPDEEMWTAALEAGATDVCASDDVQSVLTSVLRNLGAARPAAA
jgi:DNA-binding NarL/FixJ family response regulator